MHMTSMPSVRLTGLMIMLLTTVPALATEPVQLPLVSPAGAVQQVDGSTIRVLDPDGELRWGLHLAAFGR
ncbi:MAG: hypothetical protein ACOCXJ_04195, partial [Planctomycetota bacterium]